MSAGDRRDTSLLQEADTSRAAGNGASPAAELDRWLSQKLRFVPLSRIF
jgi:hypothetical protein